MWGKGRFGGQVSSFVYFALAGVGGAGRGRAGLMPAVHGGGFVLFSSVGLSYELWQGGILGLG